MNFRRQVYALLDPENHANPARRTRLALVGVILVGIVSVSIGTLETIGPWTRLFSTALSGLVAALFLVEYAARLWIAPEVRRGIPGRTGSVRLRWAVSPEGLIDLVAILPALAVLSGVGRLGAESSGVFVMLWVLKLATHAPGVELIARVVRNERSALGAVMVLFVIVLMSAATLVHLLEGANQPEAFGSIPASMWWAIVTLTTAGYGDVVPHSIVGRVLAGTVMVCGVAVLALLAGILATGFAEEVKRREFVRIWELVARVPFFADVGAIAISDIVGRLRSRNYPAGAIVLRRGGPGDSMYFIVSGEVEIRIGPRPVRLRDGAFFGEMALLDRRPRSADIVTVSPCVLLTLNVADFYQIAGQQPSLVAAIEDEARRRHAANVAASGD